MGVFSSRGLIAFTFILLLQHEFKIMMAALASQPQFTAPDSSLLDLTEQSNSHFHNTSNNEMDQRLTRNKFLIRKCCGRGQIYNFNMEEDVADRKERCVKYSITDSSSRIKNKNQIFIEHKQHLPSGYALDNFEVDTGFPRNCELDLLLQPDKKVDDLFYPLPSGQLMVPHRFWLFQFDVHCIEDYFENGNFTKPMRVAFTCSSNQTVFPTTAIDNVGKLQLDFIGPVIPAELSPIAGRTVIRKCCDRNEVYSFQYGRCTENQGFETDYFDDLQQTRKDDMFFRIGPLNCFPNHQYTNNFNLTSNGSLAIGSMSNSISDMSDQLLSIEHYCIEDVVYFDADGLPVTSNQAFFCSDQDNGDQQLSEFNTPEYPGDFSTPYETDYNISITSDQNVSEFNIPEYPDYFDTTYEIDYNNSVNPGQHSPEFSTPQYPGDFNTLNEMDYNDSGKIKTPKCCPLGYVIDQSNTCQLLKLGEGSSGEEQIISQALNNFFLSKHKIVSNLIPKNSSDSCELIPFFSNDASVEILFEVDPKNELSLLIHLQTKNYWDFKLKPKPFCVDLERTRSKNEVSFQPQGFYCAIQNHHVSIHYPVLLCISAAGLIVTFIIYFFVPAKGSAKLVTTGFGVGSRGTRTPTMAMMLTGRILLCHVLTLSLTFVCLAMVQREYFPPNQTSCVAIGYFVYGASIASFAWLTVYCFDYYRIFTGAFKVSNDMLFIPYSIFGWGVPIIALIAMAITQFQSTELGVSDIVNPNIGLFNCWFPHGGISALVFFYGPVGTLLLLDMICFLSLIFNPNLMHCWKRKQSIRSNKKVSKEQEDFKMALKLFFITGVPWVFELAAWLPVYLSESQDVFQDNSVGKYVFEIGNLLNALRGIVIFIIFIILQRDVRHYLILRLTRIFKKDCPNNVALQHSRGNTDGDPSVSTEQVTNRRISVMTSQTHVAFAASEEQSTNEPAEQAEFDEISIL